MSEGGVIRVVIVDDHPLMREGLRALVASVPDTVIRAISTQPVSSQISSIVRTSSSLVSEKLTP